MNEEFFKQAELSLAAYANLIMGVDIKDELKISGLSDVQADWFIQIYSGRSIRIFGLFHRQYLWIKIQENIACHTWYRRRRFKGSIDGSD